MVKKPKENYIMIHENVTEFRYQCPEVSLGQPAHPCHVFYGPDDWPRVWGK